MPVTSCGVESESASELGSKEEEGEEEDVMVSELSAEEGWPSGGSGNRSVVLLVCVVVVVVAVDANPLAPDPPAELDAAGFIAPWRSLSLAAAACN